MMRSSAWQAGSSCASVLAEVMAVISASTAGFFTPAKLPESSVSAALLPNRSANSWPGLCVPWKAMEVMSKSNFCRRCWYSAKSTERKRSVMPSFSRLRIQGVMVRTPPSLLSMYSSTMACPAPLRRAPSRTSQPAFFKSCCARRRLARSDESPSVRGGTVMGPKAAAGMSLRKGSISASSSGDGVPRVSQAVLPNRPFTRW
jgi:hypothetical protein